MISRAIGTSAIAAACGAVFLSGSCAKPPQQGTAAVPCVNTSEMFLTPMLKGREHWYGPHLAAAGETNLCATKDESVEVYRFTWLRSFHPPVVVRAERTDMAIRLYAKQLSGAGGYDPGSLQDTRETALDPTQWQELIELVDGTGFWLESTPETDSRPPGLDGAQWIFEGVRRGMYRAIDRWSPDEHSPIRQLGVLLLKQAEMLPADADVVY
jgi:hypothetical protein